MTLGAEIFQSLRVAAPQKIIDEFDKLEKLMLAAPQSETTQFVNTLRRILAKCKREPKV